jgi:hypothetical protein
LVNVSASFLNSSSAFVTRPPETVEFLVEAFLAGFSFAAAFLWLFLGAGRLPPLHWEVYWCRHLRNLLGSSRASVFFFAWRHGGNDGVGDDRESICSSSSLNVLKEKIE